MASHFASHVQESVLGSGGERVASASVHEMHALKQLACAIIHRAIDDAESTGSKVTPDDVVSAKEFLCNVDGTLLPWAVLAGIRLDAVVEYALRRGYDAHQTLTETPEQRYERSVVNMTELAGNSPVSKVADAVAEALPIEEQQQ